MVCLDKVFRETSISAQQLFFLFRQRKIAYPGFFFSVKLLGLTFANHVISATAMSTVHPNAAPEPAPTMNPDMQHWEVSSFYTSSGWESVQFKNLTKVLWMQMECSELLRFWRTPWRTKTAKRRYGGCTSSPWQLVTTWDELLMQNCSSNTLAGVGWSSCPSIPIILYLSNSAFGSRTK